MSWGLKIQEMGNGESYTGIADLGEWPHFPVGEERRFVEVIVFLANLLRSTSFHDTHGSKENRKLCNFICTCECHPKSTTGRIYTNRCPSITNEH